MDLAKPAKGARRREQQARTRVSKMAETRAKIAAKVRDGWRCRRCGRLVFQAAQAMHIDDKGMGGDHGLHSSLRSDYVTGCHDCHQGPRSVHSGHIAIVCLTDQRGDGLVEFRDQQPGDRHGRSSPA